MAEYLYDAWGNSEVINLTSANLGDVNPFRYRGYYYDLETGLYYLSSRYYDPKIGRFISADDISYLDPSSINGLNLYAYCGNNPVMYFDRDGNFPVLTLLAIAAIFLFTPVGGTVAHVATSVISYAEMAINDDGNWNIWFYCWYAFSTKTRFMG